MLGIGRLGVGLYAFRVANGLEKPHFEILRRLGGGVELRRYAPYVIAETEVLTASMREGSSVGFRRVAGYIFGRNRPCEKLKMTAPVRISQRGEAAGVQMKMTAPVRLAPATTGKTRVSFVMEKGYTPGNAPRPTDRNVRVRNVSPHILAARRFSGPPPSERRVARERQRLLEALDANGLKLASGADGEETLVYGYHDPFITPSFLRRNEVCVRVSDSGV